jgi:hypothetical protein
MKRLTAAAAAGLVLAMTGPAGAVTVKNTSSGEFAIGVDLGNTEKVETIGAGKSVEIDCQNGCGVTGPASLDRYDSPLEIEVSPSRLRHP